MQFYVSRNKNLLFEGKIDRRDDEEERNDVVPAESLGLENGDDDDGKDDQRDGFLYDFQLDKAERPPIDGRAHAIGGNHE